MVNFAGQFGVTLKAFTEVDRASLGAAQRQVGQTLGRSSQTTGLSQAEKKIAQVSAGTQGWAKRIGTVKEQLRTSWHLDGIGKALDQFREGRKQLTDLSEQAGKLMTPIGTLAAAGSLAGIGGLVESFGSRSGGLLRTAGNLGVSSDLLQRLQGGAELAGVSAEGATGALDALQQNLRAAQFGLPEGARTLGTAKLLGLSVNDNPENFLKNLAGKMQGQAPLVQRAMAEAFGLGDLLPLLRQGRSAIEDYMAAAERNRKLTEGQLQAGRELELAYSGATQATLGLKDAIGSQLAPTFVPLLKTWNTWMNDVKESPGQLKMVTTGVELLGIAFGVTLVSGLAKATAAMTAWWVLPATKLLRGLAMAGGGILSGAAAGLGIFFGGKATGGNEITPEANQPAFQKYLDEHRVGTGRAVAPQGSIAPPTGNLSSIAMPPDTGLSGTELAINNFGGLRRPGIIAGPVGGGFKSFATPELGVQATASLLQGYQDRHGLNTLRGIITRWAPPFENDTAKLIGDAVQQTGFGPDQPLNLHDAATLSTVSAAMIRNEVGPRGPSQNVVNGVISGLSDAASAGYEPATAADTSHHVIIDVNAPAGTRSRIGHASGPSDLTVRTQQAFVSP